MNHSMQQIVLPNLGQGLREAVVVDLPVGGGDCVKQGDEIVILESDKSVHAIECPQAGVVVDIYVNLGQVVEVGAVLATVSEKASLGAQVKKVDYENRKDTIFAIREATKDDLEKMFSIWVPQQATASKGLPLNNDIFDHFARIYSYREPPFCVWVAEFQGAIVGWASLLPCKNNPLSRHLTAEVSLYVDDPNATVSPAVLLLRNATTHAKNSRMGFLLGYTGRTNQRSAELLNAGGFRPLGQANNRTVLWVFDCQ